MSESSSANCVAVHQPLPVYLVHYNAPDWVRSACASIQLSDEPVELIVVNNSGGDLSLGPDVRVIESGGNLGYTGGANVALRDWLGGDADTCVVGSHDLHVARDALSQMKQVLADNPDVGIAGPTLNHEPSMPEPSPGVEDVAWVSGTCMMFRRTCIEQVGFFDERYRSYAEDFDICYRARKAGWRVVTGRSSVAHGLGTATGGQAARRIANSVLFDVKHYGRLGGYRTLGRIVVSVPQSVIMGRPRRALAHLAAIPQAVRHIVTFREPHGNGEGRPDVLTPGEKALDRGMEVIVVAYGSPEMLRRALEPVRELPITVVDNSSMPEIEALCAELGCRYIDPGYNGGFAAGVNVGLSRRQVPGGDILLLNPDAEISVKATQRLQRALLTDNRLASVGPQQVDESGKQIRVSWPFASPGGVWLDAVGLSRLRPVSEYVSGAILLLRAEAIQQVGLFDDAFFLYEEEEDWAYRASKLGWRHAVVPEVTAMHACGGTSSDEQKRQVHFHASQERFLRKHFGAVGWQIARAGQVVGDTTRSFLRTGDARRALRARAGLYWKGPLRVEADKYAPPTGSTRGKEARR